MRAIAALSVIGVHCCFPSGFTGRSGLGNYTARLEIGVEVFFVISGFLLYRPFAAAHFAGRPSPSMRGFWVRRLRRIIPAYWVAVLIINYLVHANTIRHAWDSPLIYLGFAQIYFPNYVLTGITQAWSLCTEMSFYLTIPLYAAVVGRRVRRPDEQLRVEIVGLVSLVAISLAYRIPVLLVHSGLARTMPNWLPGYLDVFSLGMLLAVVSSWLRQTDRQPAWLWHPAMPWLSWLAAFGAFVAVSNLGLPWVPDVTSGVGISLARQTLYGLFGLLMVAPAVFGPQHHGLVRRFLQLRVMVFLGVVSYGIYLWHELWIHQFLVWTGDRLFTFPLPDMLIPVTGLAIVAASASYYLVERPVLQGRRPPLHRRPARSAPASG